MTLCKRLIARLDIKGNRLIKGVRFEGLRVIGDPVEAAYKYAQEGVDEILFIDAVASLYGRNSLTEILRATSREVFVPITAGGGVRSVKDAGRLLATGADKIAVNSGALKRPELIRELAKEFGRQCVVVSIQARRQTQSRWEVMGEAGRERSGKELLDWIEEIQVLGAGEILLTSVDQDGTCQGADRELNKRAMANISVPLVIGGGFTTISDISKGFEHKAVGGIAIGAALHKHKLDLESCKEGLIQKGYDIRGSKLIARGPEEQPIKCKVGIADYGMGNQQSLINAIEYLGGIVCLSDQWDQLKGCDVLILPGVGAFPEGIKKLKQKGLFDPLINWTKNGKPLLGICLGMQMLFEEGYEFEKTRGLGIIKGKIKKLNPYIKGGLVALPLPHMGWNKLEAEKGEVQIISGMEQYFVHSYAATDVEQDIILQTTTYGEETIIATIRKGNICGFQFHPERSGKNGLNLLKTIINQQLGRV